MLFSSNATATTEIYTLSLHDALPICYDARKGPTGMQSASPILPAQILVVISLKPPRIRLQRSEEHTSELQSLTNLVCRLLLEKKKKNNERQENDTYNERTIHQIRISF